MKTTDSRECRNCNNSEFIDFTVQVSRSRERYAAAIDQSKTCIDCHKGIAHELAESAFQAEKKLSAELSARYICRWINPVCSFPAEPSRKLKRQESSGR